MSTLDAPMIAQATCVVESCKLTYVLQIGRYY